MSELLTKGLAAKRESRQIEFKQAFDPCSAANWCEIVKDIIAIANSRGGIIFIGLDNAGEPVTSDLSAAIAIDPATIADKVRTYTGTDFSDFEIVATTKGGIRIIALIIGQSLVPIVFMNPGTYELLNGKQGSAFSRGTVYFRHGAKSEPGSTEDIRQAFEHRLEEMRKEWQKGLRKVVTAPRGSSITVLPAEVIHSPSPSATPIRIVDDASAPAFRLIDPNITHPYRQMDVVQEIRRRSSALASLSAYDIYAVRLAYQIDKQERFFYRPKFGSPQYSEDFVTYLIKSYADNPDFFTKARSRLKNK
jgi:hypothetical protein